MTLFLMAFSHVLDFLTPLSWDLHIHCLKWIEEAPSLNKDIYKALICGKRLPSQESLKKIFTDTGIIHLMVVSGLHLIFLEQIWNKLPRWPFKSLMITLSLILYVLVAQMHPPIVRALFYICISKISQNLRLFWSPAWITLFSGLGCLIFNPYWIFSISLQMSWIGSMVFQFPLKNKSKLSLCLIGYIMFLPIISEWHALNPLSILVNWLVTPFVAMTLFPLSIISLFIHPLYFISDSLWSFLIYCLSYVQNFLQQIPFHIPPLHDSLRWIYVFLLFLIVQVAHLIMKRRPTKKKDTTCFIL